MAQKAAISYIYDKCKTKIYKVTYNHEQKPHLWFIYTINAFIVQINHKCVPNTV